MKIRKILIWVVVGLVALAILIQLIPFGQNHANPPVIAEPKWDSPKTRSLVHQVCFDCHSNETVWPWYSNVAPISWLVYLDTVNGRSRLNFSEWNHPQRSADEVVEVVQDGEMPPFIYLIKHAEARLSAEDRQALVTGLQNSLH